MIGYKVLPISLLTAMPETFSPETPTFVLSAVAEYFKVLSEVSRLQILSCLRNGPMNGKEIAEATGLGQANLSKHLKALVQTGLISRQPRGVSVYYEIADPLIFALCEGVRDRLGQRIQERAMEFERLKTFTRLM